MPHWFECFAEKKTIFKDSKDSPQSTKDGIQHQQKLR